MNLLGSLRKEKPKFTGSMTALITPFDNGELDLNSFRNIVKHQIDNGTDGLIPVGTTGESPTLSHYEHEKIVEVCIEESSGKVSVIAGAGSNSTSEACALASHAGKAGADAVLVVTPYYNKPSQSGLYSHFMSVADAAKIPVIVYDIPGRSIIPVHDSTLVKLCENHELISGIKDATADISRPPRLLRLIGKDFHNYLVKMQQHYLILQLVGMGVYLFHQILPQNFCHICITLGKIKTFKNLLKFICK